MDNVKMKVNSKVHDIHVYVHYSLPLEVHMQVEDGISILRRIVVPPRLETKKEFNG